MTDHDPTFPPILDDNLILHIFGYLDVKSLCRVSHANREFHDLSGKHLHWEPHCRRRWQGKQNVRRFLAAPISWKERYRNAELDARRPFIVPEEVSYFRWHLVYNGLPSSMGLRHFRPDGIYQSPYFGSVLWALDIYNRLCFQGMALRVERNPDNWGWVIGRETSTVYHSVELDDAGGNG